MIVHRIRAGLYSIETDAGETWTVEERREPADYGGGWAWYATQDDALDVALDPLPRLRDVKAALA